MVCVEGVVAVSGVVDVVRLLVVVEVEVGRRRADCARWIA